MNVGELQELIRELPKEAQVKMLLKIPGSVDDWKKCLVESAVYDYDGICLCED